MAEPPRDDAAEQATRTEHHKQEAQQILELHRTDKILPPSLFIRILEVYLLFVGAIAAVGVFAFYSHHDIAMERLFAASIVLILIAPCAVLLYLLVGFSKRFVPANAASSMQSLISRIAQSSIGKFVVRNKRIVYLLALLFNFVMSTCMVTYAIIRFPEHPRTSLVVIVAYMALLLTFVTLEVVLRFERSILGLAKSVLAVAKADQATLAAFEATVASLKATQRVQQAMIHTFVMKPDQVDAPPEEEAPPKCD